MTAGLWVRGDKRPPSMQTILSYLKKPSTYVILLIGGILVLAYSRFVGPVKTIAAKLPGAQPPTA